MLYVMINAGRSGEVCQCASAQPQILASNNRRCFCMYAIISAGNKQYRVSQGETIYIDKVNQEDGSTISFDVLMVENNGEIKVGNPTVAGATVEGKVVAQVKGEKIMIYKYKSKKNYHRRQGHRQPYTKVEITAINA